MAKLPSGITQRKDGLYVGRFQYQGVRYNVTDQDVKKCADKLEKMKYEIKNGIYCKESLVTVDGWFHTWIEEYKEPTVKQGTVEIYRNIYKEYIKKSLGSRKLKDVRSEMIQRLYNTLKKKGFAKSTIELVNKTLRGMFEQAYENDLITKNPVKSTTIPKARESKRSRAMKLEEQELFMKYAENSDIYDICELFLSTGLRSGELRGLEWQDIDFKNKLIHVTGTLCYSTETGWRKDTPKSKTSKRDIPMLGNVEHLLKRVRRQQMERKLYLGEKWQPLKGFENLVFTNSFGYPMSPKTLNRKIDKIQNQIVKDGYEFERITPHSFRHTFATRCIENGMTPQVLKTILGHGSLAMTMDLYAHVLPDTKAEEMQKIASLF